MDLVERFFEYADCNPVRVYTVAATLAASIAYADWLTPGVSLGFLFVVPILLASGLFKVQSVLAASALAAFLREEFNPAHWLSGTTDASRWDFNFLTWQPNAFVRMWIGFAGFSLVGYCVSELNKKRRITLAQMKELDEQIQLRQAAEQQVRILIETSPLAILTLDESGRVLLANSSAASLLSFEPGAMEGADVRALLPVLGRILKTRQPSLRTTVECNAQRRDGEVFLAHIWLSTYSTAGGQALAAVIWDASENLRDKEGTGLDSMMATSRVVIGAVSHEVRNLASAALSAYRDLRAMPDAGRSEQFNALGSVLQAIERIASSGLAMASDRESAVAELGTVLDEARIVIEPGIREAGGTVAWRVPAHLPLVQADHHGLLQVFLNLARNSQAALEGASTKELIVEAAAESDVIAIRFRDTGSGVANPDELFKPFQPGANSAGLGLYISRAILRAHGGDLLYEPEPGGSCFTVELWPVEDRSR